MHCVALAVSCMCCMMPFLVRGARRSSNQSSGQCKVAHDDRITLTSALIAASNEALGVNSGPITVPVHALQLTCVNDKGVM